MFSKLLTASNLVRGTAEDLPSQVNHVWTVMLLATMGLVVSMVQYVGDPIHCWCPAHMPEVHCNYTKAMCWVKENYYVDFDKHIPQRQADKKANEITYYPWTPWILFFMAFMFKTPHLLWSGFGPLSDLDLEGLVLDADDDVDITEIATILRIWLFQAKMRRKYPFHYVKKFLGSIGIFWLGRHKQTFITGLAIFVKLCYLAVSILMFLSLRVFIDHDFLSYGYDTALDFINGIATDSERFPKDTVCDIRVRQSNNVNTYSVQCILPINMYNQKIFLFLWYWYVVLMITNAYSVMHWTFNLLSPSRRWKFVNDYVIIMDHIENQKKLRGNSEKTSVATSNTGSRNGDSSEHLSTTTNGVLILDYDNDDNFDNNNDDVNNNISDEDASLLSVGNNTDGTRLRVGNHVNFIKNDLKNINRKRKKKRRRHFQFSPIETDLEELSERMERRRLFEKTVWIYKQLDYDGVVVFRTLEMAVGVVVANDVFSELFNQMMAAENKRRK